mgnify:CR=1 FL=1
MAPPHESPSLFEPPVPQWTLLGAIAGALLVVAVFAAAVVISDTDLHVIGAAGLVAPFGGAGIRAHELEAQERRERS